LDENGFFFMGGYARFVWPAYLVTAAVLIALAVQSVTRLRRLRRQQAALERDLARSPAERSDSASRPERQAS